LRYCFEHALLTVSSLLCMCRGINRCKPAVIVVVVLASLFASSAQARVVSFEQSSDSIVAILYDAGRPVTRSAAAGAGRDMIVRLMAEVDIRFDSAGITVPSGLIPWERVTVTGAVRLPSKGWSIHLDTLAAGEVANDDFCRANSPLTLREDDFLFGSVFNWNGSITVSGEIGGDLICIGGDVALRPGAVIRGSVITIGGTLDQQAPAKVYGGRYSDRDFTYHSIEISREWEYAGDRYGFRPTFSYDKVDGARPGIRLYFQDSWLSPRIGLWAGYAFESDRWQYHLFFEQRLSSNRDIQIGAEYSRITETEDGRFIYTLENTVMALLANEDYRDYYGRHGGRLWLEVGTRERHTATLEYENYDYRWRSAAPKLWSLFWTGRDFRKNFGVLEGVADHVLVPDIFERKISLLRFGYHIKEPERDRYVTGLGYTFDGFLEIGGGDLKGDWDYSRLMGRGSVWYDFSGRYRVLLYGFAGRALRDVPAPKLFYLGGPASLRGYRVKQFVGDEAFLATLEYAIRFWDNAVTDASLVLFYDIGRASLNEEFWILDEFKSDVGVALDFGGGFRLAVAKALEESDINPVVTIRVKAGL